MKCPQCQTENPETRKFCRQCGTKLLLICPQCGSENTPGDRFCGECGQELAIAPEPMPKELSFEEKLDKIQRFLPGGLAEKILAQREKIEGERKQVTIMFCDMEGFTPLSERLDPEEVYSVMDEVFETLIHKVHDYGGTINKMTGDGIMALFGAPIAVEDAPQRAIRSALSIHREMARVSDRMKQEKGLPPLRMRIGIHSGPVVVGTLGNDLRVEFTAVGDTVNLASRMQDLAEPGSTCVTENTFRLTEGLFRFESMGEREIKGKKAPVRAYRVIAPSDQRTRFDINAERGLTPLVGRERELELLLDGFERARAGRGQAFSVIGEAGVGKSRLLYEFRKAISHEEVTFLEGKCLSYSQGVAYQPLIDIVKANFDLRDSDSEKEIREKLRRGLTQLQVEEESVLPYLLDLMSIQDSTANKTPIDREARRYQTMDALRRITIRSSEARPLILAIEDLHWVDSSSEEALQRIMESIAGARVLMLFTYRPEFIHQWGGRSYHNQINLNRLSNRESLVIAGHLLNTDRMTTELEQLLLVKTEGIPFFIEEFIRSFLDFGLIEEVNGISHLNTGSTSIVIPSTIQDVIMARVDLLSDDTKEILQMGSAIEREFSYELIKRVANLPEEELLSHLSELRNSELVYDRGVYPNSVYVFKHAIAHEIVYQSMLLTRRQQLHSKIGKAIEELYRNDLDAHATELAKHLSHSTDRDDLLRSSHYCEVAAQRALVLFAYRESVRMLETALRIQEDLNPEDKAKHCDLLQVLGNALILAGEPRRVVDKEAQLALSLAEAIGDKTRASQICVQAIWALSFYGSMSAMATPEYVQWAERADRYAEPDTVGRALADMSLGMVKYSTGQFGEGVSLLNRALELSRHLSDPETFWWIAYFWLMYVAAPQHTEERLHLAAELAERSRENVSMQTLFGALPSIGNAFLISGQRLRAEEVLSELQGIAERTGQAHYLLVSMGLDVVLAILDGRLEEAFELTQRIQTRGEELGLSEFALVAVGIAGVTPCLHLGRVNDALQITEAVELTTIPARPLCLVHLDRTAEAAEMLEQLVLARPGIGSAEDESPAWVDILLLETAVLLGHREATDLLMRRFVDSGALTTGIFYTTCIARHLGAAAALLGKPDEARTHYQAALKITAEMRFRPEVALTRLQLAELLLEHYAGEKSEALEHLDFAISEFRDMKMQPSLERALRHKETLGAELTDKS